MEEETEAREKKKVSTQYHKRPTKSHAPNQLKPFYYSRKVTTIFDYIIGEEVTDGNQILSLVFCSLNK